MLKSSVERMRANLSNAVEACCMFYDYAEVVKSDALEACEELARFDRQEGTRRTVEELRDDLRDDSSVTGASSGSYFCNRLRACVALAMGQPDFDEIETECGRLNYSDPEALDVAVRCYYLEQVSDKELWEAYVGEYGCDPFEDEDEGEDEGED